MSAVRLLGNNAAVRRRAIVSVVLCIGLGCIGLGVAGAAAGGPPQPAVQFGVADDTGKYADDSGAAFFADVASLGLATDRMTVTWDAAHPAAIADRAFLDRSIAEAGKVGVSVRLAVRPATARAVGTSAVRARQFATFVASLATRYPQVHTFVIGNEPNQPRFWQPQFTRGKAVAATGYERLLAASYDALKAVDPTVTVVGGSSRAAATTTRRRRATRHARPSASSRIWAAPTG